MTTDTPRTDAGVLLTQNLSPYQEVVDPDLARTLERENTALRASLADAEKQLHETVAACDEETVKASAAIEGIHAERDRLKRKLADAEKERASLAKDTNFAGRKIEELETQLATANQSLAEAREKIKNQAERIRYLEGATNHAGGTALTAAESLNKTLVDGAHDLLTNLTTSLALALSYGRGSADDALIGRADDFVDKLRLIRLERAALAVARPPAAGEGR